MNIIHTGKSSSENTFEIVTNYYDVIENKIK